MAFLLHRPLFSCATAALGLSGAAYGLLSHQHRNPLRIQPNHLVLHKPQRLVVLTVPEQCASASRQQPRWPECESREADDSGKHTRCVTFQLTLKLTSKLTPQHRPRLRPHDLPLQQAPRPPPRPSLPRPPHSGKTARNLNHPVQHSAKICQRRRLAQRSARQRRAESQLRRHVCAQRVRELLTVTLAASSREGLEADGIEDVAESEGSEEGWEREGRRVGGFDYKVWDRFVQGNFELLLARGR
jgi:hypothetical protein